MKVLIFLSALVLFCTSTALAQHPGVRSQYDRGTARRLSPEEAKTFGPEAGKYRYDARMIRAAEIAAQRARKHSTNYCWRYVKTALLQADAIDTYPDTILAKQAATELSNEYGFKKISVKNPYAAPVGAVLVYGGRRAGHVEIRTKTGFVSDFRSRTPSERPFLGAFVLPDRG
jgi:hypothetical protein